MKVCGCGKVYNRKQWGKLAAAKKDELITHNSYNNKCIEWRNCSCGSTLIKEVRCDCAKFVEEIFEVGATPSYIECVLAAYSDDNDLQS